MTAVISAFAKGVAMAFGMLGGALIIGIIAGLPSALWVSQKMTNFLMFTPTEKFKKPLPEMGRATTLALAGKVREATHLYEEFLLEHPEMKEIHLCLVELAFGPLQDEEYGNAIIARAERCLEFESDRDTVRHHAEVVRNQELIPLRHLGWCEVSAQEQPDVGIPELIKGRVLPKGYS
ncbi:MAG: hypothetical protein ACON5H_01630 [Akkermansiaceae bacterium]